MFRSIVFAAFLISVIPFSGFCQDVLYEEDSPLLLRNDLSVGFSIRTGGVGFSVRRGFQKTVKTKQILECEAYGKKHPKEIKTRPTQDYNAYVYGKQNAVTVFHAGAGIRRILFSRGDRAGLEIRATLTGGLSFAFLKPVYLRIRVVNSAGEPGKPVKEKFDPEKHNHSNILGKAEFSDGLGETRVIPGGYLKLGFEFDYAKADNRMSILEIGGCLDEYPVKVPIMANAKNNPYFFTLYLKIAFGGKWR